MYLVKNFLEAIGMLHEAHMYTVVDLPSEFGKTE